jgi:hypothetical protein
VANTTQSRIVALDATLLLSIPTLLAAIHFLVPTSLQQSLVFDHTRFNIYTLLTAAYVHASNTHLFSNLVGYALTAIYTYALCLFVDERKWFRRTLPIHLLALPVLVNLTSYAIFAIQYPDADPVSRGFSGVVGGLGGFLLVALYVFVKKRHDGELAYAVGLTIFLLLMQLIDLRYAGGFRLSVTGLVLLGSLLVFGQYAWRGVEIPDGEGRRDAVITVGSVGLVGVVLGVLILGLFPESEALVEGGTFTNVFAHAAGFIYGIVLTLISMPNPGEALRKSVSEVMNSFVLVGISFFILTFVFLGLFFLRIAGFPVPGVPEFEITYPVEGGRFVAGTILYVVIYLGIVQNTSILDWMTKGIARKSWGIVSSQSVPDFSPKQRWEYDQLRETYVSRVHRQTLVVPFFILYPYAALRLFTETPDLQRLAIFYIVLGVLIGSIESAVNIQIIRSDSEQQREHESWNIFSNQVEVLLLLIGGFTELVGSYGGGVDEVSQLVVWFAPFFLAIYISFKIWKGFFK